MTDYRNDIEKYLNGELTPAERNALERKALHDPFLADALEGAEQIKAAEFSKDVALLNAQIAIKKSVSVWMWPARIAAGLAIIAVSSYIVWTVMKPEPAKDLAFEKREPAVTPSMSSDSIAPTTGELSPPPVEQPSGPVVREKDVATRSTYPSKTEAKPTQSATGGAEIKSEPVADAIVAEETKADGVKAEDISVTEPVSQTKPIEKEAEVSHAKAADDLERKAAYKKKAVPAGRQDAAPAAADKNEAGLASSISPNVIRGQITSAEDGSSLPGVNVIIKGRVIGTVTDSHGNYQLNSPEQNPTLVYNFIGMQSQEVKVENKNEIDIQLHESDAELAEIVITASRIPELSYNNSITSLAYPETGSKNYKEYLKNNTRYPEQAKVNKIEGRVTVQFTIEANGTLTNFTILHSIGSGCDEELIRLIKEGTKWIPTKKDNVPVQDKAKVRLKFELPK